MGDYFGIMGTNGSKKKVVIKNSSMSFISQIITIPFTFITRSLFIKYIGIELLGLNNTFASIFTTLSLAELGFQTAIVFNLYKPLHDKNFEEVNSIINILKIIYRCVGVFFIVATLLTIPLLKYIVTGIDITYITYIYFVIQAFAFVCTYFWAYKRTLLYVDQKEYISKIWDLIFSIIFNLLQCLAIVYFKSYMGYLILKVLQTYSSNIVVHFYCSVHYSYLKNTKIDYQRLKQLLLDVKNIFASRIASFVYNSTDNLVISSFVSTVSVGYFTNYTMIMTCLKALTKSMFSPIVPILGNFLLDENDGQKREDIFFLNTFVRYLIASIIVIPTFILIDDFIFWWIGKNMLLNNHIVFLICIDFYIHLVHSSTMDFINSAGLFKTDKYIEVLGALCNITISLILVNYIGITGVLVGTVISQLIFWIGRSIIVYKQCLNLGYKSYIIYWTKNISYILVTIILVLILSILYKYLHIQNMFLQLIIGGIICEIIVCVVIFIVFFYSKEMQMMMKILHK